MLAFWVLCDPWFVRNFPDQCAGVIRRATDKPRTECDECKWVHEGTGVEQYPAGTACGDESCKGTIVDKTPHQHLIYTNQLNDLAFPVQAGPSQHVRFVCTCDRAACMFCEGGLFGCTRCNSFEGATTTECPGADMTQDQVEAVYAGRLDFVGGKWVHGATSRSSPAWFKSEAGKKEMKEYRESRNGKSNS